MAGEVLRAGENAARAQPAMKRGAHLGDALGIAPEAAVLGDGALRIYVQVQHRRKINVAAHRAKLQRHGPRGLLDQLQVAQPSQFGR